MRYINIKRISFFLMVIFLIIIYLYFYYPKKDKPFPFTEFCENCTSLNCSDWRLVDKVHYHKDDTYYFYIRKSEDTTTF